MTVKGIDVSSYQNATWSAFGLSFVFAKATEGHTVVDARQSAHAARARAAGLVFGQYHFAWPGDVQAQAQWFAEKSVTGEHDLMAIDWETTSSGTMASNADKDALIKAVKALRPNHKVGLYCNTNAWLHVDKTGYFGDFLWIAEYGVPAGKPGIRTAWTFHQYTDKPLDTNVGNFASTAALQTWAGGSGGSAKAAPAKPKSPTVDLSRIVAAARTDPRTSQGHQTYASGVRLVESALKAEGLLGAHYAGDGSFGSVTVAAYAAWQRHLGYHGKSADGIPGKTSLTKLGAKHGFTVVA
jgi:hypothetical protein